MMASRRRMTILVRRSSDVASCKSGGAVQAGASGRLRRKNGNGAVLTPYPRRHIRQSDVPWVTELVEQIVADVCAYIGNGPSSEKLHSTPGRKRSQPIPIGMRSSNERVHTPLSARGDLPGLVQHPTLFRVQN